MRAQLLATFQLYSATFYYNCDTMWTIFRNFVQLQATLEYLRQIEVQLLLKLLVKVCAIVSNFVSSLSDFSKSL